MGRRLLLFYFFKIISANNKLYVSKKKKPKTFRHGRLENPLHGLVFKGPCILGHIDEAYVL